MSATSMLPVTPQALRTPDPPVRHYRAKGEIDRAGFRLRDRRRVEYRVSGSIGRSDFPYVNRIGTLREAVEIAKDYPVQPDASTTEIVRTLLRLNEDGNGCTARMTHRFRVFLDGTLELLDGRRANTGLWNWIDQLPRPPRFRAKKELAAQISDVIRIAHHLGYTEAVEVLQRRSTHYRREGDPTLE